MQFYKRHHKWKKILCEYVINNKKTVAPHCSEAHRLACALRLTHIRLFAPRTAPCALTTLLLRQGTWESPSKPFLYKRELLMSRSMIMYLLLWTVFQRWPISCHAAKHLALPRLLRFTLTGWLNCMGCPKSLCQKGTWNSWATFGRPYGTRWELRSNFLPFSFPNGRSNRGG